VPAEASNHGRSDDEDTPLRGRCGQFGCEVRSSVFELASFGTIPTHIGRESATIIYTIQNKEGEQKAQGKAEVEFRAASPRISQTLGFPNKDPEEILRKPRSLGQSV
jgi:hypothetical protein